MKSFAPEKMIVLLLASAMGGSALAGETTNAATPVTSRDFYNAGTQLLAAKKFDAAEQMFKSALAGQEERVQPLALYNLGHARFDEGLDLLKTGPDAQKSAAQGDAALARGGNAIRSVESALGDTNVEKMVAAYLEGRGARRELGAAEKAVQAAMETYGKTLAEWRRAADDFKGAAELNPTDANAARNAETVERNIAKLVDSLRTLPPTAGKIGDQKQQLARLLSKLKGQIPQANMPPGGGGDDDDDDIQPDSLAGQKESGPREGEQMQISLSPDAAGQILEGLSINGTRRLPIGDQQGAPHRNRTGRNW